MTRRHFGLGLVMMLVAVGSGCASGGGSTRAADASRRAATDPYPKLAPYTAVRWDGDMPSVEIAGRFYQWRAIDDVTTERLIEFAKKTYGDRWKKRVSEDLVQVMTELGPAPGDKVTLRLTDLDSKQELTRVEPMTHENRQAVWRANQNAGI